MSYGTIKVDTITFTDGGVDKSISVSGLTQNPTITGNLTVTGTISGDIIEAGTSVSGVTVLGASGTFTTLTGTTTSGTTANFVNGVFSTSVSGATITGGTVNAVSGVFSTSVSGATITGDAGQYATLTGISGVFTTSISGATVTGDAGNFTTLTGGTGVFTTSISGASITGGVATITSGVFALGTNALPSISFSSDPDTGIYSPGADQVAISTGGTGALFVDANGKVGIGNESPGYKCDIDVTGSALRLNSTTSQALLVISSDDAANAKIEFGDESDNDRGAITYDNPNNALIFQANAAERLRITSTGELKHIGGGSEGSPGVYFAGSAPSNSLYVQATTGNVGLGTSSPSQLLEVENSGGSAAIGITSSDTGYAELYLGDQSNASASALSYEHTSDKLRFYNGGSPRLTIDSSGNVGIGTTSPSGKLTVDTKTAATNAVLIAASTETGRTYGLGVNASASFVIHEHTAASDRLVIDSSGRLLVGTSSSIAVASADAAIMQITQGITGLSSAFYSTADAFGPGGVIALGHGRTSTSGILSDDDVMGQIRFAGADGNDMQTVGAQISAEVDGTPGADDMPGRLVFSTTADGGSSPDPRMTIKADGKVGIGTQTPQELLDLYSTGNTTLRISGSSGGGSDVSQIDFFRIGSNVSASLKALRGGGNSEGQLAFYTATSGTPTEKARIDSSGRLLVGTSSATGNATTEIKGGTLSTTAATNKGGMLRVQSGAGNMSTASSITISDYFSIAPRRVMGVVYATTVDTSGHRTRSWKVYGKIGALSIVDDVNDSSSGGGSTPDLVLAESASGVLTITPSWTFGGAGYVWSVDLLVGCAAS